MLPVDPTVGVKRTWTHRSSNPLCLELGNVLSFMPGVHQNVVFHASSAAGNLPFLICTFPVHSDSFFSPPPNFLSFSSERPLPTEVVTCGLINLFLPEATVSADCVEYYACISSIFYAPHDLRSLCLLRRILGTGLRVIRRHVPDRVFFCFFGFLPDWF